MRLHCLGGCMEVGKSAFVLESEGTRVVLDYGVKVFTEDRLPAFPPSLDDIKLDAALISHAHLDHVGNVPALFKKQRFPWYADPATQAIAEILWKDSLKITPNLPWSIKHMKRAIKEWVPAHYGKEIVVGPITASFVDAGHILGSGMIRMQVENKVVLYSGDFKIEPTRLHRGASFSEEVDVLIMETTYADREHPPRQEAEKELMKEIYATFEEGGSVLLPAFAVGRSQELIEIIRAYDDDIPIYLDGMCKAVTDVYLRFRNLLAHPAKFKRDVDSVECVFSIRQRKMAEREPSVIISTAGMLEGGPALSYIQHLNPESKIILTGFCVEGTNGWYLLNKNQIKYGEDFLDVSLPVKYIDFSAHAGRSDLLELVRRTNPEKIICIHGDHPDKFAEELREKGYDAVAPKIGDVLEL